MRACKAPDTREAAGAAARRLSWETGCAALFADRVRCAVEFLIQHVLLVTRQAAAVLRRHVVRLLADHVEAVMQRAALRRRVIALVDAIVDAAAQVADAPVDLLKALRRDVMGIRARQRAWLRPCDDARRQRRNQCAACRRANQPLHSILLAVVCEKTTEETARIRDAMTPGPQLFVMDRSFRIVRRGCVPAHSTAIRANGRRRPS